MVDYKLTQLNVTVREVVVGNKRLTKTMFNQIEHESCFNEKMDFIGDLIIGYTKDKDDRFLLWVNKGKLRKTKLTPYYKLSRSADYTKLYEVSWFLKKGKIEFEGLDKGEQAVSETVADPKLYEALVDKVRSFLDSLVDQQIFL
ncbi:hypothetical protein GCM10011386_41280 [Parapedobacter defluvii]|uniref:Uncharacterized protein n=1 Tax=Parapedobacter defluvii TaxID=2045106 RepID=A0ABQ1MQV4_9SPHI|nr:hypothetical protein [Parapedobacter defluvii]GGC44749.1 hypothetical protein GCM10011386_41280 [Parapedobacter defluvii]